MIRAPSADHRDREGTVLDETYFHFESPRESVVIKAQPLLPDTDVQTTVDQWGAVKLHPGTPSRMGARFTWRIDEEPWSRPARVKQVELGWLADGKYRIDAAIQSIERNPGSDRGNGPAKTSEVPD